MARKPRIHFAGALYHVIARGNHGQVVFPEEDDFRLYLNFLKEYKAKLGFHIYAFVLMPTHIHFLIKTQDIALSQLMHRLQGRYTRNYNLKYQTWGHLFQGRYKAILCEQDSYFLELSAYIHLNPVRAGIAKDPSDYRWSSYRTYVEEDKTDLVDPNFLLGQFSPQKGPAHREYRKFVMARFGQGWRKDLHEVKDQRFLGPDKFVEEIQKGSREKVSRIFKIPIDDIILLVEERLRIRRSLLFSPNRNRKGALGRAVVAYLGRKWAGYSLRMVAEHFHRDPVVMSGGIGRLEERLAGDRDFSCRVETLEKNLIRNRKTTIVN
jgi:putative transposase